MKKKAPRGQNIGKYDRKPKESSIPKTMYVACVGRPCPAQGFDGRVGVFRVARKIQCKKTNNTNWKGTPKYRERGKWYVTDVNMKASDFLFLMKESVIPEIQEKMQWAPEGQVVTVQLDNATPHTGQETIKKLNNS